MENNEQGKLGLGACVAILAGGCIGSSIFSLSGLTMFYAGPAAILSWALAAVILGMYGILVAELSIRYPKSGGVYVFPSKAIGKTERTGKIWGFIAAWGYLVSNTIAIAFAAIYVGIYLGVSIPALSGPTMQVILAIASVVFCMVLNLLQITGAGKLNNILVGALVVSMLIYICVALFGGTWNPANFQNFFGQGSMGTFGFLQAVPNAMTGYGSIVAIAFMVGEIKNPNRTVPKSLAIALAIVVALYMLMIVSTMGNITTQFLIDNPGMRFIPVFAAAFTTLSNVPWLSLVISIAAVIALITTMLVVLALNARALASMADDGMMPKWFVKRNKNNVPSFATIFVSVLCIVLSCFPSITEILVNLGSIIAAITIMIVCASLLASRKKQPHIPGNYKAPGGNVLAILAIVMIAICYIPGFFNAQGTVWLFTLAVYVVGIAIMYVMLNKQKNLTHNTKA